MAAPGAGRIRWIVGGLLLATWSCGDATGPQTQQQEETLASFVVSAPAEIDDGVPFDLTITARGSEGTEPFDFTGRVTLAVSSGSVAPSAIDIVAGATASSVTLSGATGPVVVSTAAGSATGSATIPSVILRRLQGDAAAPANAAIPVRAYDPAIAGFSAEPGGPEGAEVSYDVIVVQFEPSATVASVNALLENHEAKIVGASPGPTAAVGLLALQLPTRDHAELDAVVMEFEADPAVRRVLKDMLMDVAQTTATGGDVLAGWSWDLTPAGGNWGLELLRVPQMWNLNPSVTKSGVKTRVLVIDAGFDAVHPDLGWEALSGGAASSDHGTHVAGIIGAEFSNGRGIDGVTPYAHLWGHRIGSASGGGSSLVSALIDTYLIPEMGDPRVVNVSMGFHYASIGINPASSPAWQARVSTAGASLADFLTDLRSFGATPLIVVSAGNDSDPATNGGIGEVEAALNSPFTYAGIELDQPEILVIESVRNAPGTAGGATRSAFSNLGGHLSAPGSDVVSAVIDGYGYKSGTSMAAPHVAGLAAYLFAVDPSLTNAEVREILLSTAVEVDGGATAPRVDAFAALMDIDRLNGNDAVLRRLVDIDDGTADGNQRTTIDGSFTNEDADGNGGMGDGMVDMSDFRRFRDWLLQVEDGEDTRLDGGATHAKKDVDGDGQVEAPAAENVFPRGDFNGDGRLDRGATAFVGGALGASVTDLAVLQSRFVDPPYAVADLPGLLNSSDVTIDASRILDLEGVTRATLRLERAPGGELVTTRELTPAEHHIVVTLPESEGGYDAKLVALNAASDSIGGTEEWLTPAVGGDVRWFPEATPTLVIELTVPGQASVDDPFPVNARVGVKAPLGAVEYRSGIVVDLEATGGTVSPATVTSDADGFVATEARFVTGSDRVTITATATFGLLDEAVDIGTVLPAATGGLTVDRISIGGRGQNVIAHAGAYDGNQTPDRVSDSCEDGPTLAEGGEPPLPELDPSVPHALTWTCSAAASNGSASGSSSATYGANVHAISDASGALQRIEWSASGTVTASGNYRWNPPTYTYEGSGNAHGGHTLYVELTVAVATTLTVSGAWDHKFTRLALGRIDAPAEWTWDSGLGTDGSVNEDVVLQPGQYLLRLSDAIRVYSPYAAAGSNSESGEVNVTVTVGGPPS